MTFEPLPCAERPWLFDATSGRETVLARNLCRGCAALDWCTGERNRARRDGALAYFEGTWAGKLYRSRSAQKRAEQGRKPKLPVEDMQARWRAWRDLRKHGLSYEEIGRRYEVHHTTVINALGRLRDMERRAS